jgi:nucleoside-diphosphate-sugar epimerase
MTTVLLTGAGGFLGTQVLAALLRRDYSVHAIDRKRPSGMDAAGVIWHSVDLLDRDAVHALFGLVRPQGLIHLAWMTNHGLYWRSPSNLEWLAASLLLLQDFALYGGQRVVIAGSSAEYQWGGLGNLDEISTPIIPDSLYGTSKNALREVVEKWAPGANVSWAWARFFNMFGPGENPVRLVPKVIRTLLDGRELPFDSGAIVRDFLHVDDAGDAVAALFQSFVQGPVNVASGQPLSVRDVIAIIATYMQASDRIHFDAQANRHEPARVVASVSRLHDEVGWQPHKGIIERLHETCDWWRLAKD